MKLIFPDELNLAVQAIEAGGLVVVPTHRWYMICANARDREACNRIYAGKGRPRSKSLAYVLPSRIAADDLFVMTPAAHRLAAAFWPGDLAMFLRWRDLDHAQRHEPVGVPNALVTLDPGLLGQLAEQCTVPIAATTANRSDPSSTTGPAITAEEVQQFVTEAGINVAYCINGGISPLAHHLTIIDCTEPHAKIVRSGVVHDRAVNAAIAAVATGAGTEAVS
ncbi:Sua5/YciO/YrdC/YwlC family protein [Micromonospora sp. WMMD1082]|uniref:L-threonylcarbamoyladenylate synthase n=1 Tax=Micromonospora sp. WMMD1082 TaxID=3016104 RepID=UPI002417BADD|nr:Sua5/YciO/YrdC/YwlC family protein [Micromonospora sp. WMMD1082]MDG4793477.1 Sua5/YciO/YrdC/YwlC family protein [Micromonospora sp. WMMD1082]